MYQILSRPVAALTLDMSSTNITTAAAVQIIAAMPAGASRLQAFNGGAKPIKIFAGKLGTTAIPMWLPAGQSTPMLDIEGQVGANDIIKAQAFGADVVTGLLVLNFFG